MRQFTDNSGHKWDVCINVQQVRLIRDLLKINLYRAMANDFEVYNQIIGDPVLLVDLLYLLCRDQAKAAGVSDDKFGEAMYGEALEHAIDAFTEELIDFFPDARMRAAMRSFMAKVKSVQNTIIEHADRAVQAIPETLMTSNSSGSSLASSALTPDPLPSAS